MRGEGRDMKGGGQGRKLCFSPSNPGSAAPGLEAERDAIHINRMLNIPWLACPTLRAEQGAT